MPRTISLAQYIFRRLRQLNCTAIHGVPGDNFLHALGCSQLDGLRWVGNASELCAGYAADGYARIAPELLLRDSKYSHSKVVGALYTTFGVGELSAINAIAGSYAENSPVVHLVGAPKRAFMKGSATRPVHHSLSDGNMEVYLNMAKSITCAQALLHHYDSPTQAAEAYDSVLESVVQQSRPGYVLLPSDMINEPVLEDMLSNPLALKRARQNKTIEEEAVEGVIAKIRVAERPLIIVDGLSYPFQFQQAINAIIAETGIPAMCYTAGKGVVDESLPSWDSSLPNTTEYSRLADLVLFIGPRLSDTNTAKWSAIPETQNTISFNLDCITTAEAEWSEISTQSVLDQLAKRVKDFAKPIHTYSPEMGAKQRNSPTGNSGSPSFAHSAAITQDAFWPTLSTFIRPHDTVLLANGTPVIGARELSLPTPTQVICSCVWYSIGHMLPAAQGISIAKRDHRLPGRTILFEGDGSFQVTCQGISDIIRHRLDVTIFMINNGGYTYERWLHGMDEDFNNVPPWRYLDAPAFFGADLNDASYPIFTRRVASWGQLQEVLENERLADGKGLKIVDVIMDSKDVPSKAKPGLLRAAEVLRSS